MKNEITLTRNAWFGDDRTTLEFPPEWELNLIQSQPLPALNENRIQSILAASIASSSFRGSLDRSTKVVVLVDDLTRPTPVEPVLSILIKELLQLGILKDNISILIACGTHSGITQTEISKKLGNRIFQEFKITIHDCHKGCVQIGRTSRNTPIEINRVLLENEVKIGISGVYPHPVAGFSGGGKLLALGAGGYTTIRTLHDQVSGASQRDGSIEHDFRREVNEIAVKVGYDLSINLVVNQQREIAGCFCGSSLSAFQNAVDFYLEHFTVLSDPGADVVISDMYPFDMDFQYSFDRGLWPFETSSNSAVKIILASSPLGISGHELFPISHPFFTRLWRRVRYFRLSELLQIKRRIRAIQKMMWRRKQQIIVISPYLSQQDLKAALPASQVVPDWNACMKFLNQEIESGSIRKVAVYKTAPLLIQMVDKKSDLYQSLVKRIFI